MSKLFRVIFTLLIVAFMAQGTFAQAVTPTPGMATNEFELVGVLDSITQTSIVVAGFTINISGAEVQRGLLPGDIVKVHASVGAAGLEAREVGLFSSSADDGSNDNNGNTNSNDNSVVDNSNDNGDDNSNDNSSTPLLPGEFEITGVLNSIQGTLWQVGGQLIDVATAQMNDVIAVGDTVKLHVSNVGGQLVAREAELAGFGNAATCATTTPNGWRNYSIRGGDTLSQIAARAGITVEELARVNCITDIRIVVAGANLFVPRLGGFGDDNFNSNDNGSDDNGNDNGDDNGNDNGSNDNGDDNGNDNGSNDNGDDDGNDNGSNDNGDDNGGSGHGGDDNGNDNGDDDD